MNPIYKIGDVVNTYFPNDDLKNPGLKLRPCVIVKFIPPDDCVLVCVTGTDWSQSNNGYWIQDNTKDYSVMRLTKPSFINLDDIKKLPLSAIKNKKGYCLKIDEILEKLKL